MAAGTYKGHCHCERVAYEVNLDLGKVISCNCSICSKKGTLLAFTNGDNFKLLKGEDSLSDYQFNKKAIHHLFCKNCGVTSFARGTTPDGKKMIAINARCLDGVDLSKLTIQEVDGKSF